MKETLPTKTGIEMEYQIVADDHILWPEEAIEMVDKYQADRDRVEVTTFYSSGMRRYIDGHHLEMCSRESPSWLLGHQVLAIENILLGSVGNALGHEKDIKLPLSVSDGDYTRGFHLNVAFEANTMRDEWKCSVGIDTLVKLFMPIFGTGRASLSEVNLYEGSSSFSLSTKKHRFPNIRFRKEGLSRSGDNVLEIRTLDYPISTFSLRHMGSFFCALVKTGFKYHPNDIYKKIEDENILTAVDYDTRGEFLDTGLLAAANFRIRTLLYMQRYAEEIGLNESELKAVEEVGMMNKLIATDLNDEWLNQNNFGVYKFNKVMNLRERIIADNPHIDPYRLALKLYDYATVMDTLGGKYNIVGTYRKWGNVDDEFLIEDILAAEAGKDYTGYKDVQNRMKFVKEAGESGEIKHGEGVDYSRLSNAGKVKVMNFNNVEKILAEFDGDATIYALNWGNIQIRNINKAIQYKF